MNFGGQVMSGRERTLPDGLSLMKHGWSDIIRKESYL